jgi:catechol 2,3-dioxygenase-like lactoylglutathione lyase family enzyme
MTPALQFRVSLTVDDFEKAVSFYRDVLGLPLANDWSTPQGRCFVLSVGKATIELIDHNQANYIDDVEVGRRVSGQIRFAFQFSDVQSAVSRAKANGAQILHDPVETPWKDVNARVVGPDAMQMTLFESPQSAK